MLLQYVVCLDCWPFFQGVNRGQQNYIFLKETSINIIYKQTNKVFSFECNIYYLIFSCCTAHTPFHYGCFTHFKNIGALVSTTQLKIFNQPFQYSPWISLKSFLYFLHLCFGTAVAWILAIVDFSAFWYKTMKCVTSVETKRTMF